MEFYSEAVQREVQSDVDAMDSSEAFDLDSHFRLLER